MKRPGHSCEQRQPRHKQPWLLLAATTSLILATVWIIAQTSLQPNPDEISRQTTVNKPGSKSDGVHEDVPANSEGSLAWLNSRGTIALSKQLTAELNHVDPLTDDWDTEAFTERALAQLSAIGDFFQTNDEETLSRLLSHEFRCTALVPHEWRSTTDDSQFVVRRWDSGHSSVSLEANSGQQVFVQSLAELRELFDESQPPHIYFKVTRVAGMSPVETTVLVQADGPSQAGRLQQNAVWECEWEFDESETSPRLRTIRLMSVVEVAGKAKAPLFADATASAMRDVPAYKAQLVRGLDDWRSRMDWRLGLPITGEFGIALGDANGDGWDDVFLCEPGGLPNRLLLRQEDGTVQDASHSAGIDYLEPCYSALFVDFDNDGDQDLAIGSGRYLLIMQNDGTGTYSNRRILTLESYLRSIAAADYDGDGAVDIYVCGYFPADQTNSIGLGNPVPYHDANNGGRNYLFRNAGDLNFADVTDSVNLDENNTRFSYAAGWEDFDNDGDQDLYVANDFGRNCLYRNDGGKFVDVAGQSGVEDISAGMSVSWADFNHDGNFDLYVGNMFSSAGNRIAYHRQFRDGSEEELDAFRRHARGNTLFANQGDGTFRDVSMSMGVTMGRWAWSSEFVDFNNDGWEDLFVLNGMVTSRTDPADL